MTWRASCHCPSQRKARRSRRGRRIARWALERVWGLLHSLLPLPSLVLSHPIQEGTSLGVISKISSGAQRSLFPDPALMSLCKSQLCHLLAVWPPESPSLSLSGTESLHSYMYSEGLGLSCTSVDTCVAPVPFVLSVPTNPQGRGCCHPLWPTHATPRPSQCEGC